CQSRGITITGVESAAQHIKGKLLVLDAQEQVNTSSVNLVVMLNQRLQVSDRTNLTQPGSTTLANLGEKAFGTLQAGSGSIRTSGGDISLDKLLLNSFHEFLPGSINLSKKPTILTIDFNPLQLRRHGTQLSVDITSDSG